MYCLGSVSPHHGPRTDSLNIGMRFYIEIWPTDRREGPQRGTAERDFSVTLLACTVTIPALSSIASTISWVFFARTGVWMYPCTLSTLTMPDNASVPKVVCFNPASRRRLRRGTAQSEQPDWTGTCYSSISARQLSQAHLFRACTKTLSLHDFVILR